MLRGREIGKIFKKYVNHEAAHLNKYKWDQPLLDFIFVLPQIEPPITLTPTLAPCIAMATTTTGTLLQQAMEPIVNPVELRLAIYVQLAGTYLLALVLVNLVYLAIA